MEENKVPAGVTAVETQEEEKRDSNLTNILKDKTNLEGHSNELETTESSDKFVKIGDVHTELFDRAHEAVDNNVDQVDSKKESTKESLNKVDKVTSRNDSIDSNGSLKSPVSILDPNSNSFTPPSSTESTLPKSLSSTSKPSATALPFSPKLIPLPLSPQPSAASVSSKPLAALATPFSPTFTSSISQEAVSEYNEVEPHLKPIWQPAKTTIVKIGAGSTSTTLNENKVNTITPTVESNLPPILLYSEINYEQYHEEYGYDGIGDHEFNEGFVEEIVAPVDEFWSLPKESSKIRIELSKSKPISEVKVVEKKDENVGKEKGTDHPLKLNLNLINRMSPNSTPLPPSPSSSSSKTYVTSSSELPFKFGTGVYEVKNEPKAEGLLSSESNSADENDEDWEDEVEGEESFSSYLTEDTIVLKDGLEEGGKEIEATKIFKLMVNGKDNFEGIKKVKEPEKDTKLAKNDWTRLTNSIAEIPAFVPKSSTNSTTSPNSKTKTKPRISSSKEKSFSGNANPDVRTKLYETSAPPKTFNFFPQPQSQIQHQPVQGQLPPPRQNQPQSPLTQMNSYAIGQGPVWTPQLNQPPSNFNPYALTPNQLAQLAQSNFSNQSKSHPPAFPGPLNNSQFPPLGFNHSTASNNSQNQQQQQNQNQQYSQHQLRPQQYQQQSPMNNGGNRSQVVSTAQLQLQLHRQPYVPNPIIIRAPDATSNNGSLSKRNTVLPTSASVELDRVAAGSSCTVEEFERTIKELILQVENASSIRKDQSKALELMKASKERYKHENDLLLEKVSNRDTEIEGFKALKAQQIRTIEETRKELKVAKSLLEKTKEDYAEWKDVNGQLNEALEEEIIRLQTELSRATAEKKELTEKLSSTISSKSLVEYQLMSKEEELYRWNQEKGFTVVPTTSSATSSATTATSPRQRDSDNELAFLQVVRSRVASLESQLLLANSSIKSLESRISNYKLDSEEAGSIIDELSDELAIAKKKNLDLTQQLNATKPGASASTSAPTPSTSPSAAAAWKKDTNAPSKLFSDSIRAIPVARPKGPPTSVSSSPPISWRGQNK